MPTPQPSKPAATSQGAPKVAATPPPPPAPKAPDAPRSTPPRSASAGAPPAPPPAARPPVDAGVQAILRQYVPQPQQGGSGSPAPSRAPVASAPGKPAAANPLQAAGQAAQQRAVNPHQQEYIAESQAHIGHPDLDKPINLPSIPLGGGNAFLAGNPGQTGNSNPAPAAGASYSYGGVTYNGPHYTSGAVVSANPAQHVGALTYFGTGQVVSSGGITSFAGPIQQGPTKSGQSGGFAYVGPAPVHDGAVTYFGGAAPIHEQGKSGQSGAVTRFTKDVGGPAETVEAGNLRRERELQQATNDQAYRKNTGEDPYAGLSAKEKADLQAQRAATGAAIDRATLAARHAEAAAANSNQGGFPPLTFAPEPERSKVVTQPDGSRVVQGGALDGAVLKLSDPPAPAQPGSPLKPPAARPTVDGGDVQFGLQGYHPGQDPRPSADLPQLIFPEEQPKPRPRPSAGGAAASGDKRETPPAGPGTVPEPAKADTTGARADAAGAKAGAPEADAGPPTTQERPGTGATASAEKPPAARPATNPGDPAPADPDSDTSAGAGRPGGAADGRQPGNAGQALPQTQSRPASPPQGLTLEHERRASQAFLGDDRPLSTPPRATAGTPAASGQPQASPRQSQAPTPGTVAAPGGGAPAPRMGTTQSQPAPTTEGQLPQTQSRPAPDSKPAGGPDARPVAPLPDATPEAPPQGLTPADERRADEAALRDGPPPPPPPQRTERAPQPPATPPQDAKPPLTRSSPAADARPPATPQGLTPDDERKASQALLGDNPPSLAQPAGPAPGSAQGAGDPTRPQGQAGSPPPAAGGASGTAASSGSAPAGDPQPGPLSTRERPGTGSPVTAPEPAASGGPPPGQAGWNDPARSGRAELSENDQAMVQARRNLIQASAEDEAIARQNQFFDQNIDKARAQAAQQRAAKRSPAAKAALQADIDRLNKRIAEIKSGKASNDGPDPYDEYTPAAAFVLDIFNNAQKVLGYIPNKLVEGKTLDALEKARDWRIQALKDDEDVGVVARKQQLDGAIQELQAKRDDIVARYGEVAAQTWDIVNGNDLQKLKDLRARTDEIEKDPDSFAWVRQDNIQTLYQQRDDLQRRLANGEKEIEPYLRNTNDLIGAYEGTKQEIREAGNTLGPLYQQRNQLNQQLAQARQQPDDPNDAELSAIPLGSLRQVPTRDARIASLQAQLDATQSAIKQREDFLAANPDGTAEVNRILDKANDLLTEQAVAAGMGLAVSKVGEGLTKAVETATAAPPERGGVPDIAGTKESSHNSDAVNDYIAGAKERAEAAKAGTTEPAPATVERGASPPPEASNPGSAPAERTERYTPGEGPGQRPAGPPSPKEQELQAVRGQIKALDDELNTAVKRLKLSESDNPELQQPLSQQEYDALSSRVEQLQAQQRELGNRTIQLNNEVNPPQPAAGDPELAKLVGPAKETPPGRTIGKAELDDIIDPYNEYHRPAKQSPPPPVARGEDAIPTQVDVPAAEPQARPVTPGQAPGGQDAIATQPAGQAAPGRAAQDAIATQVGPPPGGDPAGRGVPPGQVPGGQDAIATQVGPAAASQGQPRSSPAQTQAFDQVLTPPASGSPRRGPGDTQVLPVSPAGEPAAPPSASATTSKPVDLSQGGTFPALIDTEPVADAARRVNQGPTTVITTDGRQVRTATTSPDGTVTAAVTNPQADAEAFYDATNRRPVDGIPSRQGRNECGPTCLADAAINQGILVSKDEVVAIASDPQNYAGFQGDAVTPFSPERGISYGGLQRAADRLGLDAQTVPFRSAQQLADLKAQGYDLLVGVETPNGSRHFVRIQGVSPDGQYVAIGNTAPGRAAQVGGLPGNQGEVLQVKFTTLYQQAAGDNAVLAAGTGLEGVNDPDGYVIALKRRGAP